MIGTYGFRLQFFLKLILQQKGQKKIKKQPTQTNSRNKNYLLVRDVEDEIKDIEFEEHDTKGEEPYQDEREDDIELDGD